MGRVKTKSSKSLSKRQTPGVRLDPTTCPVELAPAFDANAIDSPLLQLPLEIRLRIFELVVGDSRCIEIGYACPGQSLPSSIPFQSSVFTIVPASTTKGLYLPHHADYEVFPRPQAIASSCASAYKVESKFDPLNRVCRQIYRESMYLAYSLHTFAFGDLLTLEAWVASLTPQQKLAVRSIFYAEYDFADVPIIATVTLDQLPGLNRIFLPRSLRASKSVQVRDFLASLRQKNLALRFLDRPDGIARYVKVPSDARPSYTVRNDKWRRWW